MRRGLRLDRVVPWCFRTVVVAHSKAKRGLGPALALAVGTLMVKAAVAVAAASVVSVS
ncbi:hypothetical protein BCR44DRAFT_1424966, partial [Catenaria anguillulae PL171]